MTNPIQVQPHIPEGFMMNRKGDLVRVENIKEQDLLRDQLVNDLAPAAVDLHKALKAFKVAALQDIDDLVAICGERYGVKLGGTKGNVTLRTYDGKYKIERTFRETTGFTEELEAAKALFERYAERLAEGVDPNVQVIIKHAFRLNRKGQISTTEVVKLMNYDVDDPDWSTAVKALRDAMTVIGSCVYISVFERIEDTDQYRRLPLDISAL